MNRLCTACVTACVAVDIISISKYLLSVAISKNITQMRKVETCFRDRLIVIGSGEQE